MGNAFWSHIKIARGAGVPESTIESIRFGRRAESMNAEETVVLDLCEDLLEHRMNVSDETYNRAVRLLGERGTFEVAVTVGFYTTLSAVMRTFNVKPPDGEADPIP